MSTFICNISNTFYHICIAFAYISCRTCISNAITCGNMDNVTICTETFSSMVII